MKGEKRHESEFLTKFVGIIVTIVLYKNVAQIYGKIFATWFFDHLKHKTLKIQLSLFLLSSYVVTDHDDFE